MWNSMPYGSHYVHMYVLSIEQIIMIAALKFFYENM